MLTPKRKRFCQEYIKDLCATQAAIRAGYSKKTAKEQAARLLTNVNIQAEISARQGVIAEKAELDAVWVLNNLKEIAERCMQKQPAMKFDRTEKKMVQETDPETGEGIFKFDAAGANRALELIGKHIGMFVDKADQTVQGVQVIYYSEEPHKPMDAGQSKPRTGRDQDRSQTPEKPWNAGTSGCV